MTMTMTIPDTRIEKNHEKKKRLASLAEEAAGTVEKCELDTNEMTEKVKAKSAAKIAYTDVMKGTSTSRLHRPLSPSLSLSLLLSPSLSDSLCLSLSLSVSFGFGFVYYLVTFRRDVLSVFIH